MCVRLFISLTVLLLYSSSAEGVCTQATDKCILKSESVVLPNSTVKAGDDIIFQLKTTGPLNETWNIIFESTSNTTKKMLRVDPIKCTKVGYEIDIIGDDIVPAPEPKRTVYCKTEEVAGNFITSISFNQVSNYESGLVTFDDLRVTTTELNNPYASLIYPLTVAVPPQNFSITGLERDLEYKPNQNLKTFSCVAYYTRPPPTFYISIDGIGDLNLTTLMTETTVFPDSYYHPGDALIVTQSVELRIEPDYDGKFAKCRVEHLGHNNSFSSEDLETSTEMKVLGPPVPVTGTVAATGNEVFTVGSPATVLVPFHASPEPQKLFFFMSDLGGEGLEANINKNETTSGRYTNRGWTLQAVSRASVSIGRDWYALLDISTVEEEDKQRTHTLMVVNRLGSTNYTFLIPNIEDGGLSGGAIAGIVIGVLVAVLLVGLLALLFVKRRNGKKSKRIKQERKKKREEEGRGRKDNPGFDKVELESQAD